MITRAEAEDLLYEEAFRIDSGDFAGWLELFTDDAIYWVPNVVEDPTREPSVLYDDRARMEERVYRLMETPAYAQMPPSRTVRAVTNVQIVGRAEANDDVVARCTTMIHELRVGDPSQVGLGAPRSFAAACAYTFRSTNNGSWKIARKEVRLLQRELPLYNLTFIL